MKRRVTRIKIMVSRKFTPQQGKFRKNPIIRGVNQAMIIGGLVLAHSSSAKAADDLIDQITMNELGLTVAGGFAVVALFSALSIGSRTRRSRKQIKSLEQSLADARLARDQAEILLSAEGALILGFKQQLDEIPSIYGSLSISQVDFNEQNAWPMGQWLPPRELAKFHQLFEEVKRGGHDEDMVLISKGGDPLAVQARPRSGRLVFYIRHADQVQQKLQQLEGHYHQLLAEVDNLRVFFDCLPMPAWIRSEDHTITKTNAAYRAITRTEKPFDLTEGEHFEVFNQARLKKTPKKEEFVFNSPSRRHMLEVQETPSIRGTVGFAVDLSTVEKYEGLVEELIERQRALVDKFDFGMALFDRQCKLRLFNQQFAQMMNVDTQWLNTHPGEDALLEQMRKNRSIPAQSNFREWKRNFLEHHNDDVKKEQEWHLSDGRTLRVTTNKLGKFGFVYICKDISELLKLESKYISASKVQDETLDNLHECVAVFGSNGRLSLSNPAFRELWRLGEEIFSDAPHIDQIFASSPLKARDGTVLNNISNHVTTVLEERTALSEELELSNGTFYNVYVQPLSNGATLLILENVTDSVNVERMLAEHNQTLQALDESRIGFIQNISYELRAPLTNALGFAQLIADEKVGPLNEKQKEYVEDVLNATNQMVNLVEGIIELIKFEKGGRKLEYSWVEAVAVFERVQEKLGNRANIKVATPLYDQKANNVRLYVDTQSFEQLLFYSAEFAVNNSRDQSEVDVQLLESDNEWLIRSKADNLRLDEGVLQNLFEGFPHSSNKGNFHGTNLTLALVKTLSELLDGFTEVKPLENGGTQLTSHLPKHQAI